MELTADKQQDELHAVQHRASAFFSVAPWERLPVVQGKQHKAICCAEGVRVSVLTTPTSAVCQLQTQNTPL